MKKHQPTFLPLPREIRDIPNTPGFKLTVFFHDARASANAIAAQRWANGSGC